MADKESDDIKEWLTEVAASDPFERLRKFRAEIPDTLIPNDLEFAALVAPIVNEDEDRIGFNEGLSKQIDGLIAADEASKGGGSYKEWRPGAFARIGDLTRDGAMSVEKAIDKVLDELAEKGLEDHPDNLTRSYHRHALKNLIDQIGAAIEDDD